MKKVFILLTIICLASCRIVTPEEPVKPTEEAYNAYGLMTVISSGFTRENVHVKAVLKQNNRMDLYMFDIKFAAAMPVTIDMLISDVTYVKKDNMFLFKGDSIVPTAGGKPYEKYIIRNLDGKITADSITLFNYYGTTPSSYKGIIKK